MKKSIKTLFICLVILSQNAGAQSISKPWFSEEINACLTIDSAAHCVRINDFHDIEDCYLIKFKRKDNELKIIWKSSRTSIWLQRDVYWLTIDKLTNDTLVLTLLPNENGLLDEILGNKSVVKFVATPEGCDDKVKYIDMD